MSRPQAVAQSADAPSHRCTHARLPQSDTPPHPSTRPSSRTISVHARITALISLSFNNGGTWADSLDVVRDGEVKSQHCTALGCQGPEELSYSKALECANEVVIFFIGVQIDAEAEVLEILRRGARPSNCRAAEEGGATARGWQDRCHDLGRKRRTTKR